MNAAPVPVSDLAGPAGDQFERYAAAPYEYLRSLRTYGSIVPVDLSGVRTAVLYDLRAINTVFVDRLEHVGRPLVFERLTRVMGSGLITNYDWDLWLSRRRRIARPLGARTVGRLHERMCEIIDDELGRWPTGEVFELQDAVKQLTLRVVADLLFSNDLTSEAVEVIAAAVAEIHAWAEADPANADVDAEPASLVAAMAALDKYIARVLDARSPLNPGDDMMGLLLAAVGEPAARLDRRGVRDEAVTLILAGHETVTNTICFAIDLLGRHREHADEPARFVVDETLRLYPPVHITNRAITKNLTVNGDSGSEEPLHVLLPAGWEVLVPEYVIYRDPQHFERPAEFLPQRWADGSPLHLDRRAYFPFLTGPKFCVGRHFALLEATETVERFRVRFDHEMMDPVPPWGREFAVSFAPDRPMSIRLNERP